MAEKREGERGAALAGGRGRGDGGATIDAARSSHSAAVEHRFPNGLYWEKEGKLANPSMALARLGMTPRCPRHGRRVSNFSVLTASTAERS